MPEIIKSALTGHVLGATYDSAYWGARYTVEEVEENGWVTVRWDDGSTSRHCTRLAERDRRVPKVHAHMESRARDCDGPLDRHWVEVPSDADGVSDEDRDWAFRRRVLASVVNLHPLSTGQLTVTSFEDGTSRLSWHEETDEGFRAVEVTFCTDECDLEERGQRDHFAEAMGY